MKVNVSRIFLSPFGDYVTAVPPIKQRRHLMPTKTQAPTPTDAMPWDPDTGETTDAEAANAAIAESGLAGASDLNLEDYEEGAEYESSYVKLDLTAGKYCDEPGDIHMEAAGDYFIGFWQGAIWPAAFKRPCLVFLVHAFATKGGTAKFSVAPDRYKTPWWQEVVDKLVASADSFKSTGRVIQKETSNGNVAQEVLLPVVTTPPLVKVTFNGTEKLDGGRKVHRFTVVPLNLKKRR